MDPDLASLATRLGGLTVPSLQASLSGNLASPQKFLIIYAPMSSDEISFCTV